MPLGSEFLQLQSKGPEWDVELRRQKSLSWCLRTIDMLAIRGRIVGPFQQHGIAKADSTTEQIRRPMSSKSVQSVRWALQNVVLPVCYYSTIAV
jgi:hypothetical protein